MISSLRLQHFRGFSDAQFEFEPGVNIIVGPNASGKTTILEALLLLAGDGTFKGQDADLISYGTEWLRADANLESAVRTVKMKRVDEEHTVKEYELDGVKKLRLSPAQHLPVVLFEPQDMNLLVSDPAGRREYMDRILSVTKPGYAALVKNYRRALSQRNKLLKQIASRGGAGMSELFVWDLRLSELGGAVYTARKGLVLTLSASFAQAYDTIASKQEPADVLYDTPITAADYTTALLKKLSSSYEKDLLRGFTGAGPHRDDLVITLRGHDARTGASRGETRSLLLALKLLELQEVEKAFQEKPLLLLDDVFSELDGQRRRSLATAVKGYQTFITTTDVDIIVEHFTDKARIIAML